MCFRNSCFDFSFVKIILDLKLRKNSKFVLYKCQIKENAFIYCYIALSEGERMQWALAYSTAINKKRKSFNNKSKQLIIIICR